MPCSQNHMHAGAAMQSLQGHPQPAMVLMLTDDGSIATAASHEIDSRSIEPQPAVVILCKKRKASQDLTLQGSSTMSEEIKGLGDGEHEEEGEAEEEEEESVSDSILKTVREKRDH
ncbi:hypothetical protein AXG93_1615s1450 [Marchantia polymorpha subsp. ruderalis]|uniref:Uncharacterized protein n=1 Tax=Marchantia polymorpha subsp. ruderalis TaxID=1480154 RepID=A0A176VVU6_MARPO|nr:hypothetical protein AXG93_1615s1450 [Marchantia polymorpha subsp. ruderalis]